MARGLAVDTLATAVLARIEQPDERAGGVRVLRWTNAGHPPPVLVHADGTVEILERPANLMLGIDPGTTRDDHTIELPDEATLLLYTDGLVERRDPSVEVGNDALRAALTDLATHEVEDLCNTLLDRLAPDEGEDDIALIAVRMHTENRPRPPSAGPETLPEPARHEDGAS